MHLILENADFRPQTHVSSGCQWLVASSRRASGPETQIPNSRSPDSRLSRESGRESPIPDSASLIGKQGIPVSRFGRDRESAGSRWRRAGGDFLVWGVMLRAGNFGSAAVAIPRSHSGGCALSQPPRVHARPRGRCAHRSPRIGSFCDLVAAPVWV